MFNRLELLTLPCGGARRFVRGYVADHAHRAGVVLPSPRCRDCRWRQWPCVERPVRLRADQGAQPRSFDSRCLGRGLALEQRLPLAEW